MAIKKAGLPMWYIWMYSWVCIFDGLIGVLTLGYYTSNWQLIVALWYARYSLSKNKQVQITSSEPIMLVSKSYANTPEDFQWKCPHCKGLDGEHEEDCIYYGYE